MQNDIKGPNAGKEMKTRSRYIEEFSEISSHSLIVLDFRFWPHTYWRLKSFRVLLRIDW